MQDSRTLAIRPAGGGVADDLVEAIIVPNTLWTSSDPAAWSGGRLDVEGLPADLTVITERAPVGTPARSS